MVTAFRGGSCAQSQATMLLRNHCPLVEQDLFPERTVASVSREPLPIARLPGRIEESFRRQLAGVLRETQGLLHGGGRLRPKRVAVVSAATDRKPLPLSGNCSVAELMSLVIPHA